LGSEVALGDDGEVRGNELAKELARPNYRRKFEIPTEV